MIKISEFGDVIMGRCSSMHTSYKDSLLYHVRKKDIS